MKRRCLFATIALLAFTRSASAQDAAPAHQPVPEPPRNALSVQLFEFLSHGVTVQYERQLVRRFSVATSIGHRWSGGDSFDTNTTAFGIEGRFWLVGQAPLSPWSGAMIGPYIGTRMDVGLTSVSEGARFVGSSMNLSESLSFGVRMVIAQRIEITPALGSGFRHEIDPRGRLSSWTQFEAVRFGATAGVVF